MNALPLASGCKASAVLSSAAAALFLAAGSAHAILPEDLTRDGVVDRADFLTLQTNLGQPGLPGQGDINGDTLVTRADFLLLQAKLRQTVQPPTFGNPEVILDPRPDDIFCIQGLNMPNNPDDLCALLKAPNNRFIGIDPVVVAAGRWYGEIPAIPPTVFPGPVNLPIMAAVGDGARVPILPPFPDVQIPEPVWVWRNVDPAKVPVAPVGQTPVPIGIAPQPCPGFFSGPPVGGALSVLIDQDWGPGVMICIQARVLRADANQCDTRITNVKFTLAGTRFDCATRICEIIRRAFASHPRRPLAINCTVTAVGPNALITITNTDGTPIVGGNIDIKIKGPGPVIGAVDVPPAGLQPGDDFRIFGQNFPNNPDDLCVLIEGPFGHQIPVEPLLVKKGRQGVPDEIVAFVPAIGADDAAQGPFRLMVGNGRGLRPKVRPQIPGVEIGANPWVWVGGVGDMAPPGPPQGPVVECINGSLVGGKLCITFTQPWGPNTEITLGARIHKQRDNGCDTNFSNIKFTTGGSTLDCAKKICDILKAGFGSRGRPVVCSLVQNPDGSIKLTLSCASGEPIIGGHITVKIMRPPIVIEQVVVATQPRRGDTIVLRGQNLPNNPDDICFALQAADGQMIPIEIVALNLIGANRVEVRGLLPFVPVEADGNKPFQVMIGEGKGAREAFVPDSFFDIFVDPLWAWKGENADMVAAPVPVRPIFTPLTNPCWSSLPPADGKICLFIDQDWGPAPVRLTLGARIHKPCDQGHDINFGGIRFTAAGTRFDCAERICALLEQAFRQRGRAVRCTVTNVNGVAKITLECRGPEKLNAGYIKVALLP